jgi:hypothetical protein
MSSIRHIHENAPNQSETPAPIPPPSHANSPVTRSTNPTGGSKINTWKCSIALTLFSSPQFLNHTTFRSPQTREKVSPTKPSISALLAGTKSSVKGSEGNENLVQTTRCTIRVSRPYGQSLRRIFQLSVLVGGGCQQSGSQVHGDKVDGNAQYLYTQTSPQPPLASQPSPTSPLE